MRKIKTRYKVLILLFLFITIYIGKNVFDICSFSTEDQKCRADVAVILGAAAYNGEVSPVFRERINHGITLYEEGYVSLRTKIPFLARETFYYIGYKWYRVFFHQ